MRCPFCGSFANKVIDSRLAQGGEMTRRRRECEACNRRYTTYERIEQIIPVVVKKDDRREPFDRLKVMQGLRSACIKRPVSTETLERIVDEVEHALVELSEKEVASSVIGEHIMAALRRTDRVAYVRFASVYRRFKDVGEFVSELNQLLEKA